MLKILLLYLSNYTPIDYILLFSLIGLVFLNPSYAKTDPTSTANQIPESIAPEVAQNPENNRDRDRLLQPNPIPSPLPPETEPPAVEEPNLQPAPQTPTEEQVRVNKIEVLGSNVFSEEDFKNLLEPLNLEGNVVTRAQLLKAVDRVTQLYLENDYLTSDAALVEESVATGNIQIRVVEGSIEEIRVEGTRRLNESYVRDRIKRGTGTPLNTKKLESQLRLLRADPLLANVEASLRRGTGLNQSILIVRVTEAKSLTGNLGINNYSPPSVGSEKIYANVAYRNLTGLGDELSANYERSTQGGFERYDFGYRIPVNSLDGTVEIRTSFSNNEVIQEPFADFGIEGESELYEISYRQPLIRTPREELALSVGFTFQDGQTFLLDRPFGFGLGPDEDGVSRTSVFKFGQEYISRSVSGAWALRSQFNLGTGLFDATKNEDSIPDGQFFSWLGQIQRVQVLSADNFLIIQTDIQLTPDPLLPSQQFVIGGGQSVRGYRQNLLAGDGGVRFSIEDRITLQRDEGGNSTIALAPFIDAGAVFKAGNNPNDISQDQTVIAGIGLGLLWQPISGLNLRLDYAFPLVEIDNEGDNIQDDGFYFSVNYGF
jgi:hemolysin activation/secretion protein